MRQNKDLFLSVRVNEETKKELLVIASENKMSLSELISDNLKKIILKKKKKESQDAKI
jgi:antitoxin component of RelBE/YafQ-DinJ toxin-antitoxin module